MDLYNFLNELRNRKIYFRLESVRDEYVMVVIAVPGQRWEVEFSSKGDVEIEIFKSDGEIYNEEILEELLLKYTD